MSNEWDNIGNKLKSSLDKYQEGEPIDPWHDFEKRVRRSNFFKFSTVTFNVYYLSIIITLTFSAGLATYKAISFDGQLISNNLIAHNSDSINKNSNNKIAKNQTRKITDSIASIKKDNSKISSLHQNDLAVNMEESALFENLITSHFRSKDIEVSFPPLNYQFSYKQPIVFKINGSIAGPIDLIIYNNKEEEITEKNNISNNRISFNKRLPKGLYYWKLMKDDDVMQIGKFFVK